MGGESMAILLLLSSVANPPSKICSAVTSQTIALRIPAGSQEAGFLTPICAINSTPAIVVIK